MPAFKRPFTDSFNDNHGSKSLRRTQSRSRTGSLRWCQYGHSSGTPAYRGFHQRRWLAVHAWRSIIVRSRSAGGIGNDCSEITHTYLLVSLAAPVSTAALLGATGFGLRQQKPWSRIIATVGSVISLIGFPMGTIIGGYILYLLWGEKGRTVFSPAYTGVIAATPHLKYKTSIIVWILLGLLGLLTATLIVLMTIRSR